MDLIRALGALPPGLLAEVEDEELRVFVRRDMIHLDADALHDRLQHWTLTRLAGALPEAHATVSFRHASPSAPHEDATLDMQETWIGLEPMFVLEHGNDEARVGRFAALIPEWTKIMEKEGRPEGFRSPDVGAVE